MHNRKHPFVKVRYNKQVLFTERQKYIQKIDFFVLLNKVLLYRIFCRRRIFVSKSKLNAKVLHDLSTKFNFKLSASLEIVVSMRDMIILNVQFQGFSNIGSSVTKKLTYENFCVSTKEKISSSVFYLITYFIQIKKPFGIPSNIVLI